VIYQYRHVVAFVYVFALAHLFIIEIERCMQRGI
jgi:hypothetical protein